MTLPVNTDAIKSLSNIMIEAHHAQQVGIQVFNNIGATSPEYKELCSILSQSCKKIIEDVETVKSTIPM